MAGERRVPNYRKMYPAASDEVIAVLRQSERKMQYQEYDLKAERFTVNEEKQKVFFIPGREDSLERLIEAAVQFRDESTNVEEAAMKSIMIKKLKESFEHLNPDELKMIIAIYYEGKSVRQFSAEIKVPVMTIQDKKVRILGKLKKILGN